MDIRNTHRTENNSFHDKDKILRNSLNNKPKIYTAITHSFLCPPILLFSLYSYIYLLQQEFG